MRIEKYHATDMQEAFRLIKADLGSEAVVIQTRKVRLGPLGWLKKPVYEVIAAVDEEARASKFAARAEAPARAVHPARVANPLASGRERLPRPAAAEPRVSQPVAAPGRAQAAYAASPTAAFKPASPVDMNGASGTRPVVAASASPLAPSAPEGNPALGPAPADPGAPSPAAPVPAGAAGGAVVVASSDAALLREMQSSMGELKTAMDRLSKQARFGNIANFSAVLVNLYQRLVDQELSEDLAQDIVLKVNSELGPTGVSNYGLVREYVRKHIQELVAVTGPPRLMSGKTKSIFLIGPTGVGKTTTLAKLAANYCLVEHKKVALITVDTFRVAAIPQLRTYADIIGVPLEVVYTPAELGEVLTRYSDRDLLLVDTPGGSPRNSKQLEVLKEYLDAVESKETYLAVASPTKYRDMTEVFKRFSVTPIDGLLFTKIDETDRFGPLVNLLHETGARLTYLTTGQNVPQDIELADSVKMADLLLADETQP